MLQLRQVFLLLIAVLFLEPLHATGGEPHCEAKLIAPIDLAQPLKYPSLTFKEAQSLIYRREKVFTATDEGALSINVPWLKGFHFDGTPVNRMGQSLGFLGKTKKGKYVLLQPFDESGGFNPASYRAYYIQTQLELADLGAPIFGLTKIKGRNYYVRPLIDGQAPLSFWGALYSDTPFSHLLDLEAIAKELVKYYPGYVNWGIIPEHSWRDRPSDADFEHESLPLAFVLRLDRFLDQIKFVAGADGRLRVEALPPLVNDPELGYPIAMAPGNANWRFGRWNWYRYILAAQLKESEKPKFYEWLTDRSRVEWQMRFQFLAHLIRSSPVFYSRTVKMSGPQIGMLSDLERPHVRPEKIQFKNRKALKEHFGKHGPEMPYLQDEEAYLEEARQFIQAPPSDKRLYYIRKSGDVILTEVDADRMVVFSQEGLLRTFMRPSAQVHGHTYNNYYFYEQILKDEGFIE